MGFELGFGVPGSATGDLARDPGAGTPAVSPRAFVAISETNQKKISGSSTGCAACGERARAPAAARAPRRPVLQGLWFAAPALAARALPRPPARHWRRHKEDRRGPAERRAHIDPYSSAIRFDGWRGVDGTFPIPDGYEPLPTASPTVWLLTTGWRRHGASDPREVPADCRRTRTSARRTPAM